MLRATLRLGLILLVLNQLLIPSAALWSNGKGYGNNENGYKNPSNPKTFAGTSSGLPSQHTTRKGLGISAWGIVVLIVSIIVVGMALYYFSVCYPMCRGNSTNNRYDKMPKLGLPMKA